MDDISKADSAFMAAMADSGLGRYDILHDAVVNMCNEQNYAGIDHLMVLALSTGNRGCVRSVAMSVKPIVGKATESIFHRLCDFLKMKIFLNDEQINQNPALDANGVLQCLVEMSPIEVRNHYEAERFRVLQENGRVLQENERMLQENERVNRWIELLENAPGEAKETIRERTLSTHYLQPIVGSWRRKVEELEEKIKELEQEEHE